MRFFCYGFCRSLYISTAKKNNGCLNVCELSQKSKKKLENDMKHGLLYIADAVVAINDVSRVSLNVLCDV